MHDLAYWLKHTQSNDKGCMNWWGANNGVGYGRVKWKDGKKEYLHRIVYELKYGPFDQNLCVLHKCDNPRCINPEHLELGTDKKNAEDRQARNRGWNNVGESHGKVKLNEVAVKVIRFLYKKKVTARKLARVHNVTTGAIYGIVKRETWGHVP